MAEIHFSVRVQTVSNPFKDNFICFLKFLLLPNLISRWLVCLERAAAKIGGMGVPGTFSGALCLRAGEGKGTPLLTRTEAFAAEKRRPLAPKAIFYARYSTKLPFVRRGGFLNNTIG